jgi:hypothetical protein
LSISEEKDTVVGHASLVGDVDALIKRKTSKCSITAHEDVTLVEFSFDSLQRIFQSDLSLVIDLAHEVYLEGQEHLE